MLHPPGIGIEVNGLNVNEIGFTIAPCSLSPYRMNIQNKTKMLLTQKQKGVWKPQSARTFPTTDKLGMPMFISKGLVED